MKRRVAISILGTTLDAGKWENRWSRWRPNVALCQQPGLFIDRLELIHDNHSQALCHRIVADIETVAPATEVRSNVINFRDPWDFSEVYTHLRDFARNYNFDPDTEDYLVNITTGTHVVSPARGNQEERYQRPVSTKTAPFFSAQPCCRRSRTATSRRR